ncbi:TauD/TfdA family dioxygenase [Pendulispora albinea]|uniref:TauD/TfdA family dioxygenase n=1 Tax=Pendulispora albinea TaxID=2741071 RepID=A0ABZ2LWC8_9BACT
MSAMFPAVATWNQELPAIWSALRASGAVLLKEAATTPAELEALTSRFAARFRVHQDPSRRRFSADDTTQGVSGGTERIGLHSERAYLPARPELLFFGCLTPPTSGGATTLCDGAAIVEALPAEHVQRWEEMTLLWHTTMERPMWQRLWSADSPVDATAAMDGMLERAGERARTRHWFEAETMHIEYRTSSLQRGSIGGKWAFANYLLLQEEDPTGPAARRADGSPVPSELLRHAAAVADGLTVDIRWQRGDVLLIDNTRCMHGRRAIEGDERLILVRMGDARPELA